MVKQHNPQVSERRGYLAPLILDIKKISKPILSKKGLNFVDIVTDWQTIVGPKISGFTVPLKLKFSSGKDNGGILYISVTSGAFATEILHQKPLLLEKINGYFGYAAVSNIKIIQDSVMLQNNSRKNSFQKPEQPLPKKELSPVIQNIIAGIDNDDLKKALASLAELF